MDGESELQLGRIVGGADDVCRALAETFLANADAGAHAANDELLAELRDWYRRTNRV